MLHNFTGSDGSGPCGNLVLGGSTLYGTTELGGSSNGVVFKVNTDGSGYAVLHNFTGSDGALPFGELILGGSTLYGAASYGGTSNKGVVFRINTDGSGYAVLKNFTGGNDGNEPGGGLVLSGSALYGTTEAGGYAPLGGAGVVYKVNTDGSGFTVVKNFNDFTLDEAYIPSGLLVLAGSALYGTTQAGGTSANGIIFKVNTDGTGYAVLKNRTNGHPWAGLVLGGGTLYGTTWEGAVFKINTNGSGYTVLKILAGSDGRYSASPLALVGSTLYGTTYYGGSGYNSNNPGCGVVFKVNIDGSDYAVLKNFIGSDGANPETSLVWSGGMLYGTAVNGGTYQAGVIFSLACLSITNQPLTQTAETGATAVFWVKAESLTPGLSYQWFFDGTNALDGATNSLLSLTNVQLTQAGAYSTVSKVSQFAEEPRKVRESRFKTLAVWPIRVRAGTILRGTGGMTLSNAGELVTARPAFATTTVLTNTAQLYLDLATPFAPQRFYRAWQTNVLSPPSIRDVHLIPTLTLTGAIGSSVRVDYINQFGPIDAWVTLATVTLTNATQLYFDTTAFGQPTRLYRLVPLP